MNKYKNAFVNQLWLLQNVVRDIQTQGAPLNVLIRFMEKIVSKYVTVLQNTVTLCLDVSTVSTKLF